MTQDDLVDPPDPAVWEGAMRCDICGHIEVHANHAALVRTPETLDVTGLLATLQDRFHEARAGTPEWRDGVRLGLQIAMNEVGYASPAPDPGAPELCPECVGTGYVRHSGDMHFQVAPSAEPPETA